MALPAGSGTTERSTTTQNKKGLVEKRIFQPQECSKKDCNAGKVTRFITCRHYGDCLQKAVKLRWHSFTCAECKCNGRESMAAPLVPGKMLENSTPTGRRISAHHSAA